MQAIPPPSASEFSQEQSIEAREIFTSYSNLAKDSLKPP
jgi:hypothetical protein